MALHAIMCSSHSNIHLNARRRRMSHRALKDQLYAQFARVGKALASPARLELLDLLAQGERPVEGLARGLGELDPQREVVAYCRGPYCVFADEAVALLRAHGRPAARYAEGYPEWVAAGLPVERPEREGTAAP